MIVSSKRVEGVSSRSKDFLYIDSWKQLYYSIFYFPLACEFKNVNVFKVLMYDLKNVLYLIFTLLALRPSKT